MTGFFSLPTRRKQSRQAVSSVDLPLSTDGAPQKGARTNHPPAEADELGRIEGLNRPTGGFWKGSKSERGRSKSSIPRSTSLSPLPSLNESYLDNNSALAWTFSPTVVPPSKSVSGEARWGFMCERNDVVSTAVGLILGLGDVRDIVQVVSTELSRRGLDTPLLFSSLAVDLSSSKIQSLIRTLLAAIGSVQRTTSTESTPEQIAWRQEVSFSGERELAWVLRWAMGRVLRIRHGSEGKRGLVNLKDYFDWRDSERAAGYPENVFFQFTDKFESAITSILINLFNLGSSLAAHSHKGGCTPSTIASLFGPLIFGLPIFSTFIGTHKYFIQSALATEHLLLSFIQSQSFTSLQKASSIPIRLQSWINNYPSVLASDKFLQSGEPRRGCKTISADLIRRDVRTYSKELFRTAELWVGEMERESEGKDYWKGWIENVIVPSRTEGAFYPSQGPLFASVFKKRLNFPSGGLPPLRPAPHGSHEGDGRRELQNDERWGSLTEKKWGGFMEDGFDSVEIRSRRDRNNKSFRESISHKLQFDLTESATMSHLSTKRETISWNDFSKAGFSKSDTSLSTTLNLSRPIQKEITAWPEHHQDIHRQLKALQKDLPAFDYDIKPRVHGQVVFEEAFVDAWADLLLSGGWMNRSDTLLKECNWAITQYKVINQAGCSAKPESMYFVFEEMVPIEYQLRLVTPSSKKQFGLFCSTRTKNLNQSRLNFLDRAEEFDSIVSTDRPTKLISLSSRRSAVDSPQDHFLTTNSSFLNQPTKSNKISTKEAKKIQPSRPFNPHHVDFEMRVTDIGRDQGQLDVEEWIDVVRKPLVTSHSAPSIHPQDSTSGPFHRAQSVPHDLWPGALAHDPPNPTLPSSSESPCQSDPVYSHPFALSRFREDSSSEIRTNSSIRVSPSMTPTLPITPPTTVTSPRPMPEPMSVGAPMMTSPLETLPSSVPIGEVTAFSSGSTIDEDWEGSANDSNATEVFFNESEPGVFIAGADGVKYPEEYTVSLKPVGTVRGISPSTYVHGQPLQNLVEEDEEEEG